MQSLVISVLVGILLTFILFLLVYISRYRKCGPNEVMVISGRGKLGFRIVKGGGTFIVPIVERVDILSLEDMTLEVKCEDVYTLEGVPITVDGVAIVKVASEDEAIRVAAEQFLSKPSNEIANIATQTLEGHLRAILGTLTVEEVYQDREKFAQNVQNVAAVDMANMGMSIVAFTIRGVSDKHEYLNSLGRKRIAEVQRDAQIGKALAERDAMMKSALATQEAEIGKYLAETNVAESKRDYEIKKAGYNIEVNQKKAEAELAGDLQKFITSQNVKREEIQVKVIEKQTQIQIAVQEILRMQKELQAKIERQAEAEKYEIEKKATAEKFRQETVGLGDAEAIRTAGLAEAEAKRITGLAEAEVIKAQGSATADAMQKKAESWQSYNQAALVETLMKTMPELARTIAEPLSQTDKITMIVSNRGTGTSNLTSNVANILAQMPPVIKSLTGLSIKDFVGKAAGMETMNSESKEEKGKEEENA
jgi:flotillin